VTDHGRLLLAIDTATSVAVVALGDEAGRPLAEDGWTAGFRHGEELLGRIDALLTRHGADPRDLTAIVVGTGPGAFTGLRVGLATAKGLALALDRPLVGIGSGAALLDAARAAGAPPPLCLLLPAGPSDRILVVGGDGGRERPIASRLGPADPVPPTGSLVAVDLTGRAEAAALERGRAAQEGLGEALLRLGAARLRSTGADDLAALVPEYVTLPRGVVRETGDIVVGPA
jgi:tRNA threonylcarbamoyladenosine biosynthesis protein TsaB